MSVCIYVHKSGRHHESDIYISQKLVLLCYKSQSKMNILLFQNGLNVLCLLTVVLNDFTFLPKVNSSKKKNPFFKDFVSEFFFKQTVDASFIDVLIVVKKNHICNFLLK